MADDDLPTPAAEAPSPVVTDDVGAAPPSPTLAFAIAMSVAAAAIGTYYLAAQQYFQSRLAMKVAPPLIDDAARAAMLDRLPVFAAFAVLTGAAIAAAHVWPRATAVALAGLGGIAALIAGVVGRHAMVGALTIYVLVLGAGYLALAWAYARNGSRAAWATLLATSGVLALVTFFGAPTLRDLIGVPIWGALLIPGLFTAGAMALRHAPPRAA